MFLCVCEGLDVFVLCVHRTSLSLFCPLVFHLCVQPARRFHVSVFNRLCQYLSVPYSEHRLLKEGCRKPVLGVFTRP